MLKNIYQLIHSLCKFNQGHRIINYLFKYYYLSYCHQLQES